MMRRFFIILLITLIATGVSAQNKRRIDPVKQSTNTVLRPAKGTKEEVIQQYLSGDTTAALQQLRSDSLAKIYPHYPLLTEATFGVDFGDAILMAFGQKYSSFGVNATLNMWNRLQPAIEIGFGRANSTPDDMNFTYKTSLSPYFRLGVNYNFTFKNEPKYQALVGLRFGYSTFKNDVTDVNYTNNYWQEKATFSLTGEKSHATWGEFLVGMRVLLWKQISAGWQVRYHSVFKCKDNAQSSPWFIPGYGERNKHWNFTLSLYYTIPLSKDKWPKKEEKVVKK